MEGLCSRSLCLQLQNLLVSPASPRRPLAMRGMRGGWECKPPSASGKILSGYQKKARSQSIHRQCLSLFCADSRSQLYLCPNQNTEGTPEDITMSRWNLSNHIGHQSMCPSLPSTFTVAGLMEVSQGVKSTPRLKII